MPKPVNCIIELRKKRAADIEGLLFIRVSVGGPKPYERKSLSYTIPEKFWDAEDFRVLRGFPDHDRINLDIAPHLAEVRRELEEMQRRGMPITNATVKQILGTSSAGDVLAYWEAYLQYLEKPRKTKAGDAQKFSPNYIKKVRTEYNRLYTYTGGRLAFDQINKRWLEDYEVHLAPILDAHTSLPITFDKLKTVLFRAEADGLFSMQACRGFVWPPYRDPDRPYLTLDQVDDIIEKIYSGDLDSDPTLKGTACYFVVECLCGIRFSDWRRFTVERLIDKDAIKVRAKKNGEPVYFPLHKSPRLSTMVAYIRDNRILPPGTEQETNRLLKTLATLADIPTQLTTHVGRHTCCTLLLELGYSEAAVAEVIGVSLRTVAIYAKVTRRKLTNEYQRFGGL